MLPTREALERTPPAGGSRPAREVFVTGLLIAALVAGTCVLYAGDLDLGFFDIDDRTYVLENPNLRTLDGRSLGRILVEPYFANYSPLHILSYALDRALGGLDPRAFHLSSNVWAGVAAGLLLLVGKRILVSTPAALLAAVLFVLHPSHVEAVAWISSRKDLVAAAFALPALLAYLRSRRGGPRARAWYAASVALFGFAAAGKLSVVLLPAFLLAHDLWVEGRRLRESILDKLPFLGLAVAFVLPTLAAQPSTRQSMDPGAGGLAVLQSLWLLTGFGEYTLYRVAPPRMVPGMAWVFGGGVLLALLAATLLVRRRLGGKPAALSLGVLTALLPAQALALLHPVADRYLYFPSTFAALLVGSAAVSLARRFGRAGACLATAGGVLLGGLWGRSTLERLAEWRDPRSVWFAASANSSDASVFYLLGTHYQDRADRLKADLAAGGRDAERARSLAGTVWKDDPRLAGLLSEWNGGGFNGAATKEYRAALLDLASEAFGRAEEVKGTLLMPNLFFSRGKVSFERGDLDGALRGFERALDESRQHTSQSVREEFEVRCAYAMGVVAWSRRDYEKALGHLRAAEETQVRYGGNWEPEIGAQRARLERILQRAGR